MLKYIQLGLFAITFFCSSATAHFPWLIVDPSGTTSLYFGEDVTDKTYKLPAAIAKSKVHWIAANGTVKSLEMSKVESDSFVGLKAKTSVPKGSLVKTQVTYGIYGGMKLDYYAVHQPANPTKKQLAALGLDLYAVVQLTASGGAEVTVFWKGKPLEGVEVKLYCDDGHEEGAGDTDKNGKVSFTNKEVELGLNAIVVGTRQQDATGELAGKKFKGAAHYLALTFYRPKQKTTENSKVSEVKFHKPLKEALTSFGAAVLDDYLYVFSGHDGEAHGTGIDQLSHNFRRLKFDDPSAEWEDLKMHQPAQSTVLISDGKFLYRIGGLSFLNKDSTEKTNYESTSFFSRYNVQTDEWTELAPLPTPRSSIDAAFLDGKIYVAGGWNLQGESSRNAEWQEDILEFNLAQPEKGWRTLPGPGYKTRAVSMAAYKGKIYLFGGIQDRGMTRKVSVFDPKTEKWSAGPELRSDNRMSGFATSSFATGGNLYVTGYSGNVYSLNDQANEWSNCGRLMYPRFFLRLLPADNNRLLAVAGSSPITGRTASVESFVVDENSGLRMTSWSVNFKGRAKHSQSLVLNRNKLYAFGGNASRKSHDFSREAFVKEAFVFDIEKRSYERLSDLPTPTQSAVAIKNNQTSEHSQVVLVGGLGIREDGKFGSLDQMLGFDPEGKSWEVLSTKLPKPRAMFAACNFEDAVWMIGGSDAGHGSGLDESVLHWWGDDSKIVALPGVKLPNPRRSFAGILVDKKFYAIGGIAKGIVDAVDVFNMETRKWEKGVSPKVSRVFPTICSIGKKIYLFGGFAKKGNHFGAAESLEVFDTETQIWSTVAEKVPGVPPSMQMMATSDRLLFYGIDNSTDGLANFVVLDPHPMQEPTKVEPFSFTGRRSSSTDDDVKRLMRRDENRDGKLNAKELGKRLRKLLDEGDSDKDGSLNRDEIKKILAKNASK